MELALDPDESPEGLLARIEEKIIQRMYSLYRRQLDRLKFEKIETDKALLKIAQFTPNSAQQTLAEIEQPKPDKQKNACCAVI